MRAGDVGAPAPDGRRALVAQEVSARYGAGPMVLDGVSLTVPPGRIVGLGGPSGTGKSTLARVLTGLLAPSTGRVECDGRPVRARAGALSGAVGMLFQSPRRSCSPHHTLADVVAEPLLLRRGRARLRAAGAVDADGTARAEVVASACRRVGLTDDLHGRLTTEVSLGQLQRAALARALVARPDYLVCDEATAMLDAATAATIAHVIREECDAGLGVLAISHDAPFLAAWADEVYDLAELTKGTSG